MSGLKIVIEPEPQSGADNMRVDAEMLDRALTSNEQTLRFYSWNAPTVSLGHFQKSHTVPEEFLELPQVGRLSGGGAILHHHELTYSLALAPNHQWSSRPSDLYDFVHDAFIGEFRDAGINTCLRRNSSEHFDELAEEPFLCFSRHSEFDVVCGKHKLIGSAQRRRKGAVLQHGSLILKRSEYAPDFPGLFDLSSFDANDLPERIAARLSADFAS